MICGRNMKEVTKNNFNNLILLLMMNGSFPNRTVHRVDQNTAHSTLHQLFMNYFTAFSGPRTFRS